MHLGPRPVLGLLLVIVVAFLWVFAGEIIQGLQTSGDWDHPYAITWFNTSCFALYLLGLPFGAYKNKLPRSKRRNTSEEGESTIKNTTDSSAPHAPAKGTSTIAPENELLITQVAPRRRLGLWSLTKRALLFSVPNFLANFLYSDSLSRTSVTSSTIISSLSSAWTILFCALLLRDRATLVEAAAAVLTIGGCCLVGVSDGGGGADTVWGDVEALASSVFYGVYTTLFRRLLGPYDTSVALFLGLAGAAVLVLYWPLILVLDATGLDVMTPLTWDLVPALLVNALLGTVLSDFLWALSVNFASPIVSTVGISLSIPISLAIDAIFSGQAFDALYICGAVVVLLGFAVVAIPDTWLRRLGLRGRLWVRD
eukprot:gnl/Chilomastix_cuspidata/5374.p1 GENE.gnl/Chilomastix_cuspidata/5374~~gnl/Chilomastix_cuspidata/5374.p1  ORF type:complete len:368 (+),score=122.43 gnl/Chilomastix_cuspidata/5374:486-1589(+)